MNARRILGGAFLLAAFAASAAIAAPAATKKVGKFDVYADAARTGKFDTFSEGSKIGKFDTYTDGARQGKFDGKFILGVMTTGIYCLPSCATRPARSCVRRSRE